MTARRGETLSLLLIALVTLALLSPARGRALDLVASASYGKDPAQTMEIYRDAGGSREPGVIMVHGGGWAAGSDHGLAAEAGELAHAGDVVFDINYRLDSPLLPGFPMQVDDVAAATRWAIRHARHYGADPARMYLLGGSAGATLAAQAGEQLDTASGRLVTGVVILSGRMNFVAFPQDLGGGVSGAFDPLVNIPQYLGCAIESCSTTLERAASPLDHVTNGCPRFLIFNSENEDMPLDQAQHMTSVLQQHGCSVDLSLVPGTAHAYAYYNQVEPQIVQFLADPGGATRRLPADASS